MLGVGARRKRLGEGVRDACGGKGQLGKKHRDWHVEGLGATYQIFFF